MTTQDKQACYDAYFALYAMKVLGIFPSYQCQKQLRNTQKRFQPINEKSTKTFEEIFQEALDNLD